MEVLKAGKRSFSATTKPSATPFDAFSQGTAGECRVNTKQMMAIENLYHSSASVQAARTILHGQLLGSGLSVTRSGQAVKLTPAFQKHLENDWMAFARKVVDCTLMWGMVVVSIEEEEKRPFAAFRESDPNSAQQSKRSRQSVDGAPRGQPGDPQTKNASEAAEAVAKAPGPLQFASSNVPNLIPVVPCFGTYEIALTPSGRAAYKRTARIFTTSPAHAYTEDKFAQVFFRTEPDVNGSIVSPMAACFEQAAFVNSLRDLALSAEVVRATPTLVTQSAPRGNQVGQGGVDTASLFFDAEARQVQQQSADNEASERAAQLALTARLAAELNRVRTTVHDPSSSNQPASVTSLPPEVPPRLFALPEKQVLVPNALQPQARTDLEALMRLANDHIACSLGVPASVVFEGKFSSNSMSQLQLLNTTVASIALFVNSVLTSSYNAIYGTDVDDTELILRVAPLSSNTEIQSLYTAGLIDFETALPACLHSLGCSAEEIASAIERRRQLEEEQKKMKAIEEKTSKAELERREKDAKNPPDRAGAGGGGRGGASKPAADSKAAKPAPAKPASESGGD